MNRRHLLKVVSCAAVISMICGLAGQSAQAASDHREKRYTHFCAEKLVGPNVVRPGQWVKIEGLLHEQAPYAYHDRSKDKWVWLRSYGQVPISARGYVQSDSSGYVSFMVRAPSMRGYACVRLEFDGDPKHFSSRSSEVRFLVRP